jgi:ADP-ribose pyrophosphatase
MASRNDEAGPGYLAALPPRARYRGSADAGEIEIAAERADEGGGATGVVYGDEWVQVVRDAVRFPSGREGTYLRIFGNPAVDGPSGAVILPLLNGRILLRRMFRHATRAWEVEAPRGGCHPDDAGIAATAARELAEEIGQEAQELVPLGTVYGDTGLLATSAAVFLAVLTPGDPRPRPDDREAFGELVAWSREELFAAVAAGEVRDGYTLSALALAVASGRL